MLAKGKAAAAAIVFTIMVLAAVNAGWWWYYHSVKAFLEDQLSQRLRGVAATAALGISDYQLSELLADNLDVYAEVFNYVDSLAALDSLSDAAIIDLDFNYVVSLREYVLTEGYLLAQLNYDSISVALGGQPSVSELYNVDGTYLKSAYAPLVDELGTVQAIFVVEAGAGYFSLIDALRRNLYFLAGGSAGIVLLLLVFYIIYNRRLAAAEEKIFQASSQAVLGRMVAVVSHEIKNPLMILHAAGESLQSKYQDEEASFFVDEVERLDRIVTGYLSFARGQGMINREKADLTQLLQKLTAQFMPEFNDSGVRFEDDISESLSDIYVDTIALRQVFINLILNARDAARENPDGGKVKISARDDGGSVRIGVADNGPGIKATHRTRLFEPFFTTKTKGSGLGLYLSKRIIEEHRGTIAVTGDKSGMTVFEITLPKGAPS